MRALHGDQGDSPSDTRSGVGSCLPASMTLLESLEACDLSLRGPSPIRRAGLTGLSACGSSDVLEHAVRMFEFVGIEVGAVGDDGLLSHVEFGERVVIEVVEVAGEVLVGEALGVVPRGLGVGAEGCGARPQQLDVVGDFVALPIRGDSGGGREPGSGIYLDGGPCSERPCPYGHGAGVDLLAQPPQALADQVGCLAGHCGGG